MADDMQVKREIILEADAETLERMRKEGHARGFTVYCDEGERIGGDNSAPPRLPNSVCRGGLTADANFPDGENAQNSYDKAKVYVTGAFQERGSVITSKEAPEKIAKVVRNAEAGCYVIQTIRRPTK